MAENPNSIGQIRELIFGETISQIEQHFEELEKKISELEHSASGAKQKLTELESQSNALEKRINKTANDSAESLQKELNAIRGSLNQKIDSLKDAAASRAELSSWFTEIGVRLKDAATD